MSVAASTLYIRNRCSSTASSLQRHPHLRGLFVAVAVAIGTHYVFAVLRPLVFLDGGSTAVCWPTDGILLAVVLMCRRRHWPWIVLGFVANRLVEWQTEGSSFSWTVIDGLSNLFEIFLPAFFLPAFNNLSEWITTPRLIVRFTLIALVAAPLGAALLPSWFIHHQNGWAYWPLVLHWETGDSLGIAMWTPLIFVLFSRETYKIFYPDRLAQTLIFLTSIMVLSWVVFHQAAYPIAFLVFPLLVILVSYTGFSGAVLAVNGLTIVAAAATIRGNGPFMLVQGAHEPFRIVTLQIYLTLAMVMSFTIAILGLEREAFEAKLRLALHQTELLATHDGLTKLGNRRLFDTTFVTEWNRAVREHRSLGLLMLDADSFKSYNDLYGHPAGDACLCQIAGAITSIVRRAGDLAARYGGEEFVILLLGSTLDQATEVAEKVRQQVQKLDLQHKGNPNLQVTISIGCSAIVPSIGVNPQVLMDAADAALYEAKERGRNRVECRTPILSAREP